MSRLEKRVQKLEGGSEGSFPKRVFWIIYDPEATDLSEADFVRAEEERLGVTADLGLTRKQIHEART